MRVKRRKPLKPLTRSRATLDQMAQAQDALILILSHDPRVQAAYDAWRRRQRGTTGRALLASVAQHKADDLAELQRVVRAELGLAHTGVAPLLLQAFGYTLATELSGQPPGRLVSEPDPTPRLSPGRAAKNRGRHIVRNVEWFYRNKIKRETVYAIAKGAHMAGVWRAGVSPSVVDTGIRRAEQLLAAVKVDGEKLI